MGAPDREWELTVLEEVLTEGDSPSLDRLLVILGVDEFHRDVLLDVVVAGRWRAMERPFVWAKQAVRGKSERTDQTRAHAKEIYPSFDQSKWEFFISVQSSGLRKCPPRHRELRSLSQSSSNKEKWPETPRQQEIEGRKQGFADMRSSTDYDDAAWVAERSHSWRIGGDFERKDEDRLNSSGPLRLRLPPHVLTPITVEWSADPVLVPNWVLIAHLSGFDEWEEWALVLMSNGIGEVTAKRLWETEEEQKAIRAAYHRVARTGIGRIRAALKIN
jgi:hypothetical protein